MATITIDVRSGPQGPVYIINGVPAGNTLVINDYVHPDAAVSATGATSGPATPTADSNGNRGKKITQTY